ncbi:protein FANTASTIC FOUR 3-like [Vicia villosa]|uniref:protein FANTASTIC FOUR 3-like n=1 Tax=Vicia villosa TaxID=3911 RepID=UPI00273C1FAB|nr:protein FANTASTIC FOUR 3-like [Vicia villosa]
MAATVCHPGLQLHLETQLVESRTLRLRLPSPKQSIDLAFKSCFTDSNIKTQHHREENININKTETFQTKPNNGGWNFLDALSNISQKTSMKETTTTASYVHPQQKRSSLVLSPKSLEMCTENLGNESGTDIVENDMLLSLMGKTEESQQQQQQQQQQPCREVLGGSKKAKIQNFPPPLTTIRGSESLRVRPHREDGRLVIEVTKVPPRTSCFEADRSHGRLRLCFSTNETREEEQEEEFEEEDGDVVDDVDDVIDENEELLNEEELSENEIIRKEIKDIEEEKEEAEEELLEESGIVVACGESKDSESDVRMKKYERVRKCKEGGGESENNESIWMAATA